MVHYYLLYAVYCWVLTLGLFYAVFSSRSRVSTLRVGQFRWPYEELTTETGHGRAWWLADAQEPQATRGSQDSSELVAGTMRKERTVEPHLMGAAVPWPQEGVQASQSALLHDPELSLIWAATPCQVVTA